jgi:hypothetical protein
MLAASNIPRKNLIAMPPEKLVRVAESARTPPHAVTQNAEYLASGRTWRRRFVGY